MCTLEPSFLIHRSLVSIDPWTCNHEVPGFAGPSVPVPGIQLHKHDPDVCNYRQNARIGRTQCPRPYLESIVQLQNTYYRY